MTGSEDIGSGNHVIVELESEFLTNTGEMDTPGAIFSREAWVGLRNDTLGKLTVGRQNALARDVSGIYSDLDTSAALSTEETGYTNNSYKPLIFYTSSATGTPMDNAGTISLKISPKVALDYELGYQIMHASSAAYRPNNGATLLGYNPIGRAMTTGTGMRTRF